MQFPQNIITSFTIPVGATTGQRITLDGIHGEIDLFDSNDVLVGKWKPTQFGIFGDPTGTGLTIVPGSTAPQINFFVSSNPNANAYIFAPNDGNGYAQLSMNGAPFASQQGGISVYETLFLGKDEIELCIAKVSNRAIVGGAILMDSSPAVQLGAYDNGSNLLSSITMRDTSIRISPNNVGSTDNLLITYSGVLPNTKPYIGMATQAWQPITLANLWHNFGAPYDNAECIQMPDGTVLLRGLIQKGATNTGSFGQLPVNYRPLSPCMLPVTVVSGSLTGGATPRMEIDTAGNMVLSQVVVTGGIDIGLWNARFVNLF